MNWKNAPITLAAVGKLKTKHWHEAQEEYRARLRRYVPLTLTEVKDSVGKGWPDGVAMEREGNALLEAASGKVLVALTPQGERLDTGAFAKRLGTYLETSTSLAFVIGGPVGLSDVVMSKSRWRLSLSPMTLPHELARIVFLEQLYRAMTILAGEKYHK